MTLNATDLGQLLSALVIVLVVFTIVAAIRRRFRLAERRVVALERLATAAESQDRAPSSTVTPLNRAP